MECTQGGRGLLRQRFAGLLCSCSRNHQRGLINRGAVPLVKGAAAMVKSGSPATDFWAWGLKGR
jgi:hypothetical protein